MIRPTLAVTAAMLVLALPADRSRAQTEELERTAAPVIITPEMRDLPAPTDPSEYEEPSLDELELEAWYEYYYLHPDPDLVPERFVDMAAYGWFTNDRRREWSTHAAFLAQVMIEEFADDPMKRWEWARELARIDVEQQRVVWYAYWLQNDDPSWKVLSALGDDLPVAPIMLANGQPGPSPREQLASLARMKPPSWREGLPIGAGQVDMAFAQFRATGHPIYIERIARTLRYANGEVADPTSGRLIAAGHRARQTLLEEVPRHALAMEAVEAVASDLEPAGAKELSSMWPGMIGERERFLKDAKGTPWEAYQPADD